MAFNTPVVLLALGTLFAQTSAFYLPGAAPRDYAPGDTVNLFVNTLTPEVGPATTKLRSFVNYDYYHPSFQFCQPDGGPKKQPESLGSILFGDRIFDSPYQIRMMENSTECQTLCTTTVSPENAKFINERIREDYALNWLVDGLPAAEMKMDPKSGEIFYDIGMFSSNFCFNLGNVVDPDHEEAEISPILNNHYDIILKYHTKDNINYRVVGVLVWPSSNAATEGDCEVREGGKHMELSETTATTVRYTYRVMWSKSDTRWATRWDNYLHVFDPRIHWFSLINSLVIATFLCIMVSMILYRNVSRDISRYNSMDLSEDVQEDFGWKLVHGEVFRQPRWPMALSVLVGNGTQLALMVSVTLVFSLLGFLSPSNRGALATVMLVFWTLFGGIGGYASTRVYASLGGTQFRKNVFFTATLLPTFVFVIVFLLNLLLITAGSSGAVPFGTMLVIVILWFAINGPLTVVGAFIGRRHGLISNPVRVNQIPRQIPPPPRYLKPWSASLLSGVLPFGAAFVELYFVLSSLFASRAYYAFGFLSLTACIVGLTTATVTILFTYFLLCAEEYRWHWRAVFIGGGSSFWLLAYGIFYWASRLSLDSLTSVVLYLGYLFILSVFNFLITGTIGFLATYWAVRRLYSAIRVD
ncbi:hypothetical protein SISSUDRAFT_1124738 [Sistotremastrum suecicum HHB10207 ss-3]|uniref:Transmembrane 9 superfamily member n=1 Tax=Sistotremastrum suecicum HHB10207 ss-3 TaxID=1314776 RepID=A0A166IC91_9AGAM|nr:hypothetical protein SISSUDRAFT_1124738 [Sistotremastrum suecicum HHB10207 ss-3]